MGISIAESIERAMEIIRPTMLAKGRIYYRNRIIDKATSLYIDSNPTLLYHVYPDRVVDDCRAKHYGVSIGTIIKQKRYKKDNYYSGYANIKRTIKGVICETIL